VETTTMGSITKFRIGCAEMKYHEVHGVEFVRCDKIDSKNIHESKLEDGCCVECIELYEDVKESVIDDFQDENIGRLVKDMMEISHEPDTDRLNFSIWSVPKPT